MKVKRIAFFSAGFAFNRQNRLLFYEKIFPKNVEIYLLTTNKFEGKEKEKYQQQYKLNRADIVVLDYNMLKLPFEIRKFCRKNQIDALVNLGFHTSAPFLLLAKAFTKTKFFLNILVDVFEQHKLTENFKDNLKELLTLFALFPTVWLSDKVFINDKMNYNKSIRYFMQAKEKFKLLYAPANSELFKPKDKKVSRKKLKLPMDKDIVIFVGRVDYMKCSDILRELIIRNEDKHFVLVGRMMDEKIKDMVKNSKNIIYKEKLTSEELVDYYSAADLGFYMTRSGGGIGISAMEMLSCGIPVIVPDCFDLHKAKPIFQLPYDPDKVDKKVKEFFNMGKKEKENLAKEAKNFIDKTFSYEALKDEYIKAHLN